MREEELRSLQGLSQIGGPSDPAGLAKMVEALVKRMEQLSASGGLSRHAEASARLMGQLRRASSLLSGLASAPEKPPSPEQLEALLARLPREPAPVFPPSLHMPHRKKEG